MRTFIPVKNNKEVVKVYLDEICYIKREGRRLDVSTDSDHYSYYESMKNIKPIIENSMYKMGEGCYINMSKVKSFKEQCIRFENSDELYFGYHSYVKGKQFYHSYLIKEREKFLVK